MKPRREKLNLSMRKKERGGSLLLSIVIHVFIIVALATITFRYPLGQLIGLPKDRDHTPERLQYITLPRGEPTGNGSRTNATPPAKGTPAPLVAPTSIPTTIPTTPNPNATSGAVSGKTGGKGDAPAGIATGVEPTAPDPRIPLAAAPYQPPNRTPAELADSAVKAAFGVYLDSALYAAQHAGRQPGDWTKTTADGQKWGWDPGGIRLGKFTIPNAVLAALPLKVGSGMSPVEARNQAWMHSDIMLHTQQAISEDAFRDAVRRIRERKEKERREKEKPVTADGKGSDR
ncbi:MAG TPA: hypothetical protein VJW73_18995 [Gemmatimonadaceae bacterium]|nr:hypothetical protein [Gemmatimonadaceae bacterium]